MIVIAFFNNKGGVGKTTLVYHLAWMFAEMGVNVLAADLDPQANLTSLFLDDHRLAELWPPGAHPLTIHGVMCETGGGQPPHIERITSKIGLLAGDMELSGIEEERPQGSDRDTPVIQATTLLHRAMLMAAEHQKAEVVLVDLAPNLGDINRAALFASDHVVIPLASDLLSLHALSNFGPRLRALRAEWRELRKMTPYPKSGEMRPAGYVVTNYAARTASANRQWMDDIPAEYAEAVLGENASGQVRVQEDTHCLALLRNYRSLMPMAREARKPIFLLKPADGAIGAHAEAVRDCYADFRALWLRLVEVTDPCARVTLPSLAQ